MTHPLHELSLGKQTVVYPDSKEFKALMSASAVPNNLVNQFAKTLVATDTGHIYPVGVKSTGPENLPLPGYRGSDTIFVDKNHVVTRSTFFGGVQAPYRSTAPVVITDKIYDTKKIIDCTSKWCDENKDLLDNVEELTPYLPLPVALCAKAAKEGTFKETLKQWVWHSAYPYETWSNVDGVPNWAEFYKKIHEKHKWVKIANEDPIGWTFISDPVERSSLFVPTKLLHAKEYKDCKLYPAFRCSIAPRMITSPPVVHQLKAARAKMIPIGELPPLRISSMAVQSDVADGAYYMTYVELGKLVSDRQVLDVRDYNAVYGLDGSYGSLLKDACTQFWNDTTEAAPYATVSEMLIPSPGQVGYAGLRTGWERFVDISGSF